MSDYRYTFCLGIGFPGAELSDEFDLVDDLGYSTEELEDDYRLQEILDIEIREWSHNYVELWAEEA